MGELPNSGPGVKNGRGNMLRWSAFLMYWREGATVKFVDT